MGEPGLYDKTRDELAYGVADLLPSAKNETRPVNDDLETLITAPSPQ